jgi:hypothetical protein
MSFSALAEQLDSLEVCVHNLELLGCRVLSVYGRSQRNMPRVHIAQPEELLNHIDGDRYVVGEPGMFVECGVVYQRCEVFWLSTSTARGPVDDLVGNWARR